MKKFATLLLALFAVVGCTGSLEDARSIRLNAESAQAYPPAQHPEVFTMIVDFGQPIQKLIEAGHYDVVDLESSGLLGKDSGPEGTMKVDYELIHFDRPVTTRVAIITIEQRGLYAAETRELLAFGAINPEFQRNEPVVALGNVGTAPDGHQCVPVLGSDEGNTRKAGVVWLGNEGYENYMWPTGSNFLAGTRSEIKKN